MTTRHLVLVLALAMACSGKEATRPAWSPDEAQAFERARREHKGVMVELYASWSVPCEQLDHELRSGAIATVLDRSFVPVKIDVSTDSAAVDAVRQRYAADTLPAVVFVSTTGTVLERIQKLPERDELSAIIERAAQRSSRAM